MPSSYLLPHRAFPFSSFLESFDTARVRKFHRRSHEACTVRRESARREEDIAARNKRRTSMAARVDASTESRIARLKKIASSPEQRGAPLRVVG
jgi:hypothetical protein